MNNFHERDNAVKLGVRQAQGYEVAEPFDALVEASVHPRAQHRLDGQLADGREPGGESSGKGIDKCLRVGARSRFAEGLADDELLRARGPALDARRGAQSHEERHVLLAGAKFKGAVHVVHDARIPGPGNQRCDWQVRVGDVVDDVVEDLNGDAVQDRRRYGPFQFRACGIRWRPLLCHLVQLVDGDPDLAFLERVTIRGAVPAQAAVPCGWIEREVLLSLSTHLA